MIFGESLSAVGAGLLTRIGLGTPTAEWVSYLVITGFGQGIAMQLPYTGLQVVLRCVLGILRPVR